MSIQTIAKRDTKLIQANFRLPRYLVDDLKAAAELSETSQTRIVIEALRAKLPKLQKKIQKD